MNKADGNRRLFSGYATVEVIDKQGELVDIDAFKDSMKAFMDMGGNIIDSHSNKTIAKVLDYEFTKKEIEPGVFKDALLLHCEAYKHYDYHDEVWEKIKSGEYSAMSMGGRRKKGEFELKCDSNGCHNDVKGIELFEVSVVDKPANPEATIEGVNQMAKSDRPLTFSMICPQGNETPCKDCDVAKMSVEDIMKPAAFDRCVEALEDDPEIESPHAVCTAAMKGGNKGNPSSKEDTIKSGGTQMTEDEKKVEETKEEGTPPIEEEVEKNPMEQMQEDIAALQQAVAAMREEKSKQEDEKPEEEEEEEKGDAALTVKDAESIKASIDEVKKQFEALKAPAPSADAERPNMAKTNPEPTGDKKLDMLKMAEELDHRQIAELER